MKKKSLFLLTLLLGASLASCGEDKPSFSGEVQLHFGTLIGLEEKVTPRSHLKFIKRSELNALVSGKESFVLLLHGAADTCTCYTEFHEKVLVPYIKKHKLLVYAIELKEFESEEDYLGLKRISGSETLGIFKDGTLAYQYDNSNESDPWTYDYDTFAVYMNKRILDPKIFYVDEDILDSYYEGEVPFTVYFGRDTCPDCTYLTRSTLRKYIDGGKVKEDKFFYFDMDCYRGTEVYQDKKDEYGLSWSEDNPSGYSTGVFPTIYYVNPSDGEKTGDVIEASGVFYNESIKEGRISQSYFTEDRLEEYYLDYLAESTVKNKVIEGIEVGEIEKGSAARHEALAPYEEPIIEALLDYCVGSK